MFQKEFEFFRQRAVTFCERVKEAVYPEYFPLECEYAASAEPVSFADRLKLDYKPIASGEQWGRDWASAWFHVTGRIPDNFAGGEVALLVNVGGEALIFDDCGVPVYGLTGNSHFADKYTKERFLLKGGKAGDTVDIWIEGAANNLLGLVFGPVFGQMTISKEHPQGEFTGRLERCTLATFDREAWSLWLDIEVIISLIDGLPEKDFRRSRWCTVLSRAADVYNEDPANAAAARGVLKHIFDQTPSSTVMTAHGVGHAHIDTGWLWPVRETVRKCARTFSSQIALLEEYPDYIFGASSAQHYAMVKENYPELYRRIKEAVASGRWEIQGGMWVEADCNLISGESMVRQFIHGKNFFMDEFGVDVKNLWIPDVFGYSYAMPQIMKKSGCGSFLTQKLSWNQFNRFPYQTFIWRGLDDSEVVTHFPPESTYNSMVMPQTLIAAQNDYLESDILSDFMCLYGIGDGGGGPFAELIERGRRQAALDGCPRFKFDRADRFFEKISEQRHELPVWKGELYFELHRGTLTSQARTKRGNRKAEQMLALAEFISSMLPPEEYPRQLLDKAWKTLLLNQFHDIIPGSSIDMVYRTTEAELEQVLEISRELAESAAERLLGKDPDSAAVVNSLSYSCTLPVELPESWYGHEVLDGNDCRLPVQYENGRIFAEVSLPPSSVVCLKKGGRKVPETAEFSPDELVLENDLIRYKFDADARLTEAFDKELGRNLLKSGMVGNDLSLYVDNPVNWDAWDIDVYYRRQTPVKPHGVKARKTAEGPLRSVLEFDLSISGKSAMRQTVVLTGGSKRLDFHTLAEWHEEHRMLRTAFPVDVFADEASFDIQYGYVKRSMTENSSREMAQFEVCAQRYADISEGDFGVALLNDCKYGYRVKDRTLDLALLRSSTYPAAQADQGKHEFTYSLLPHCGDLVNSCVMSEAALLNRPPAVMEGMAGKLSPACYIESESITMEVLKMAEKSGSLIVRAVENKGRKSSGILHLDGGGFRVYETDLLEWHELSEYAVNDSKVLLEMKPFEIKTLKLVRM